MCDVCVRRLGAVAGMGCGAGACAIGGRYDAAVADGGAVLSDK